MTPELHAKAKQIFLEAAGIKDLRQRDARVDAACGGDASLRREVASLLAHHDARTILPEGAVAGGDGRLGLSPVSSSIASDLRVGRAAGTVAGGIFSRLFGSRRRRLGAMLGACLLLFGLGLLTKAMVHGAIREKLKGELTTILAADVEALRIWFKSQRATAQAIANDSAVKRLSQRLVESTASESAIAAILLTSDALRQLREEMQPLLDAHGYQDFVVLDKQRRILAAMEDAVLGDAKLVPQSAKFDQLTGDTAHATVLLPFPSVTPLTDVDGKWRAGVATMFSAAPIRDDDGQVCAVIGLRLQPDRDFTRILGIARSGRTGETYAFDRQGILLSESRFDVQLKQIGLIADQEYSRSILHVQIRDPGTDMTRGRRPMQPRAAQPLTRMAAEATAGRGGVDVDGYRDYRGVLVVGAWTWLDEYDLGVATEIDLDEALAPLEYLDLAFGGLLVVLVAAVVAGLWSSFFIVRLRHEVHEAQQVGQYILEKKIGEGGMGQVFLAQHALMKRPTAVKMLRADQSSRESIARFEREVQLACRLTHPNTIEIFDFGRTPEGTFYYAMEYLPGMTLEGLMQSEGAIPPARTVYLMRQVCLSLREAHAIGLVHRDIKPQNIMLCERGGEYDFVKVLDFGLVKRVAEPPSAPVTAEFHICGTPLYIAPELLRAPRDADARSDIYAIGVVLFELLTAQPPFPGDGMLQIMDQTLNAQPPWPSAHARAAIPRALDQVVVDCLAKDPTQRPASVSEILQVLDGDLGIPPWTADDARNWWLNRSGTLRIPPPA